MTKIDHIHYDNSEIPFEIRPSRRRKTIGIYIGLNGDVVVRSPRFLKEDKIREIVEKRAQWIVGKQEFVKNHVHPGLEKEFVSGESFPYLGRHYRLNIIRSPLKEGGECKLINGRFLIGVHGNLTGEGIKRAAKKTFIEWYLEHAKEKIPERVALYSRRTGAWPRRIEIKNHRRRWGSCSRSGVIRFNWKIITAPVSLVDYVIVHELCHLIRQDHSAQFWQILESIIPDYRTRRKQLREYSFQMSVFD